jgi:hypothetical protein
MRIMESQGYPVESMNSDGSISMLGGTMDLSRNLKRSLHVKI